MNKTAVVYDKWLKTLGGGEVVACTIAKALSDNGYHTTFIAGKLVDIQIIKEKLAIDLSGIDFVEAWNDEEKIKNITKGKDVFINASYMDYTIGLAKENYYYCSFPTKLDNTDLKSYIVNKIILPLASKYIKPVEFEIAPKKIVSNDGLLHYQIKNNITVVFSYLEVEKEYLCKFSVYYPFISKFDLENTKYEFSNGKIVDKKIVFDHFHNVVNYELKVEAFSKTCKLIVHYGVNDNEAYLIAPRIVILYPIVKTIMKLIEYKILNRLRAGYFHNIKKRMDSFDMIFAHSKYIVKWIKEYWDIEAKVIYPPVDMLFHKYNINEFKKKNSICSVGRFFTLGHGKKQEIMIDVFKRLYDSGFRWELHLAGGLGNEPTSISFMKELKRQVKGYPIYFHINCSRKEIEELYITSKIYWHAAGYGENPMHNPIQFEHFGIAPVEALSAGCIPVLFNGGGLPEIIDILKLNKVDCVFNTKNELLSRTTHIIHNNIKLPEKTYQLINENFSISRFKRNFLELLKT